VRDFTATSTCDSSVPDATSLAVQGAYAAIAGIGGNVAIYSIAQNQVERSLAVNEPVTCALWVGRRLIMGTSKGSLTVFDGGKEVGNLTEHAGAITALDVHPSEDIQMVASVGADKSIVFYDLSSMRRVGRAWTDSGESNFRMNCMSFY
jgi:pre-mRNA-processing factor 19